MTEYQNESLAQQTCKIKMKTNNKVLVVLICITDCCKGTHNTSYQSLVMYRKDSVTAHAIVQEKAQDAGTWKMLETRSHLHGITDGTSSFRNLFFNILKKFVLVLYELGDTLVHVKMFEFTFSVLLPIKALNIPLVLSEKTLSTVGLEKQH